MYGGNCTASGPTFCLSFAVVSHLPTENSNPRLKSVVGVNTLGVNKKKFTPKVFTRFQLPGAYSLLFTILSLPVLSRFFCATSVLFSTEVAREATICSEYV